MPDITGDDERVVALSRELDRTRREVKASREETAAATREVEKLGSQFRELAGSFAELAHLVADSGALDPVASRAWLQVSDPDDAREILAILVPWVEVVYLRYPGAALPACWAWHPWVIEELWWLRGAHVEAYSSKRPAWGKAGDWHDRQRPGVVRRIKEELGTCALELHQPGGSEEPRAFAAPLARHLEQIADAWTSTGLPAEPTPEQVEEAKEYEAARYADLT
jgi:hypothetical protein